MMSTKYKSISDQGWSHIYEYVEEKLPINMPLPRGQAVRMNMFCDASFAMVLITRKSTTCIIIFLYSTPIIWYANRQNTIKLLQN